MSNTALKFVLGSLLSIMVALPLAADTLSCHQFNPDRDGRTQRFIPGDFEDSDLNTVENPTFPGPGGFFFRPDRVITFGQVEEIELPIYPTDPKTANNPTLPDTPTAPVPEPGTLLLIAPAVLGVLKKIRR